ncbi:MAG: hypothetical protein QOD84_1939 [Acidobacteriaceae bacterium]|jgi:hypothetical protein
MSTSPLQKLELQALEQRIRLHEVITDAKIQVEIVKEKLDVRKQLRKHLLVGAVVACVMGLSLGYSSAEMMIKQPNKVRHS